MESDVSEVEGLPLQFYGPRRGTLQIDRLRRLMIAMLVDAVRCFEPKFGARQPVTRQEFAEVHRPGKLVAMDWPRPGLKLNFSRYALPECRD